jgi:hypothetical protein
MNKNRNGFITTITISLVVLLLLTIITFAIPFNKEDDTIFFVSYACGVLSIVIEMILIISQIFSNENANQKIISLPIIYNGFIFTIIQIFLTLLFYVLNVFVKVHLWTLILIECILYGVGIIKIALCIFFKESNKTYHETLANTSFMDSFRTTLKVLVKTNNIESVNKELNDVLDIALGSDPSTNNNSKEIENELNNLLKELEDAINSKQEDKAIDLIKNIKNTLIKRNELTKLGK